MGSVRSIQSSLLDSAAQIIKADSSSMAPDSTKVKKKKKILFPSFMRPNPVPQLPVKIPRP